MGAILTATRVRGATRLQPACDRSGASGRQVSCAWTNDGGAALARIEHRRTRRGPASTAPSIGGLPPAALVLLGLGLVVAVIELWPLVNAWWIGATELDTVQWLDGDRLILDDLRRVLPG